jgi:hypothetical protein
VIDGAVPVAEDLHLDVARARDHLLEVARAVAEGGLGLAPALADLLLEFVLGLDRAHAPAAAAPARLQHQRIADFGRLAADGVHVVAEHLGRRDHRHARLDRHGPRARLVAERAHRLGARADEGDAGGVAGLHEIRVLRQEAVARVDRVGAAGLGHADDLGDREIGLHRPQPLADPIRLVRLEAVQRELVLLGVDADRALAHLVGGAHHADGDLAPVGHQDLAEFGHRRCPSVASPVEYAVSRGS